MNSTEMEREIRDLLASGEIGAMEGLLVDAADWGVNIRMTLNSQFVEIDLIKNWDGFEVILLNDQEKNTVQIDELQDHNDVEDIGAILSHTGTASTL